MLNFKIAISSAILLGSLALAGCGGRPYYAGGYVVGPPPPSVYAVEGYAPGPGYAWAGGYYDLRGSSWIWVRGHWARPPYRGAVWVTPCWERYGRSYRFRRGYWR